MQFSKAAQLAVSRRYWTFGLLLKVVNYDINDFCAFISVPATCKYGALNGLSTETYETLHKYYVKNPYRSSNRKNVMQQLINAISRNLRKYANSK
jgi:hypothetical protein